jgi:hypothetical protein
MQLTPIKVPGLSLSPFGYSKLKMGSRYRTEFSQQCVMVSSDLRHPVMKQELRHQTKKICATLLPTGRKFGDNIILNATQTKARNNKQEQQEKEVE